MINGSDIEIDGHEFMRWDRDRNCGGVALYVHKSLNVTIGGIRRRKKHYPF